MHDHLSSSYRTLWASVALSSFGDGLAAAAFPLLATRFTTSPTAVAAVSVFSGLPWLLFGLGAGVVVDRTRPIGLLRLINALRAALLLLIVGLLLTEQLGLALLYTAVFALGVGETLVDTATTTVVPDLVAEEKLEKANGQMVAATVVGNELAGPALGGTLFAVAAVVPFIAHSGVLWGAVIVALAIPAVRHAHVKEDRAPFRREVTEGLRWLRRNVVVRDITLTASCFLFLDSAWFSVLVLFALQELGVGPGGFGALLAVGALGGLAGAILAGRLSSRFRMPALVGLSIALAGAAQVVVGLASNVSVVAGMLVLSSFAFGVFNVVSTSARQRLVPAPLRGRIFSSYATCTAAALLAGAFFGGLVATELGLRAPMVLGGPLLLVLAYVAFTRLSAFPRPGP